MNVKLSGPLVIAIDGPAASGKGTIARMLASHFSLDYLDTGSIYRSLGYKLLHAGHIPSDEKTAIEFAKGITPQDIKNPHLYDEGIGAAASVVSAIPEVRNVLFDFQRNFAKSPKGAVLDGRDIGTVICPDAPFKFYITADIAARAERRYKQLQNKENPVIYQSVLEDLQKRDERDSNREVAPLKVADDAVHIDTTNMGVDEVFAEIVLVISGAGIGSRQSIS
ncbi:MAG: cmk [Rickettsiaceae bacterium]|nr:cmk [Rickettsiaceae bacterium]